MSLILDALRKLEREKAAHEPGVLVVGSVPWGAGSRRRRVLLWAGAFGALALAMLAGWSLRRDSAPLPRVQPATVATPTPEPAPVALPASNDPSPTPAAPPIREATAAPPIRLSHPPAIEPEPPPTAPAQTEPSRASGPELRLSAISQRDGKPMALINERLVFEGDSFDGIRVIRIGEAEVEVEVKGERLVLRF